MRDLYIADTGGGRVLRVNAESGKVSRTAIKEFPIYSSMSPRFSYEMWACTQYETFVSFKDLQVEEGGVPMDRMDAPFQPSGIAVSADIVYVADYTSGRVFAVDRLTGQQVGDPFLTGLKKQIVSLELHPNDGSLWYLSNKGHIGRVRVTDKCPGIDVVAAGKGAAGVGGGVARSRARRPYKSVSECVDPKYNMDDWIPPPAIHDPGYMNTQIPPTYGQNATTGEDLPCDTLNLDAVLMAGHTCHRCLPEPCRNGGKCKGTQGKGFTCTCPVNWGGDVCHVRRELLVDEVTSAASRVGGVHAIFVVIVALVAMATAGWLEGQP